MKPALTASDFTFHASIELTSRCNLRCVYCAVSLPSYHGRDFDASRLAGLVRSLKKRKVHFLSVSGHGETTLVKDWHLLCDNLLREGIRLAMITNLSRRLSDAEAAVLSRFTRVTVSMDTVDPELFKKLRRSADLKVVFENMARARKASAVSGKKPRFVWCTVLSDKSIGGLLEVVKRGIREGVNGFIFLPLTKYPDIRSETQVDHISSLPAGDLKKAKQCILKAIRLARRNGCAVFCQPGVLNSIDEKLKAGTMETKKPRLVSIKKAKPKRNPRRDFVQWKPGFTRNCFHPWVFAAFDAKGEISPCCHHRPVGRLSEGGSLDEVLNGKDMRDLRNRLIKGRLGPDCRSCPSRAWIRVRHFRVRLWAYLAAARMLYHLPAARWLVSRFASRFSYF